MKACPFNHQTGRDGTKPHMCHAYEELESSFSYVTGSQSLCKVVGQYMVTTLFV